LRIAWIYPDLLSTYGDQGNAFVLAARARARGIGVEMVSPFASDPVPETADIYLIGGGEDHSQALGAERLRTDGGLARAVDRGATVFAVCAGYQIIGEVFGGERGQQSRGVGILDVRSGRGERRAVGEIVAEVDPELRVPTLTGFENHMGLTTLGPSVNPLSTTVIGVGNGDGTEGCYHRQVIGTYLHGPALARNPQLADLLLRWAIGTTALDPLHDDWFDRLRDERFGSVFGNRPKDHDPQLRAAPWSSAVRSGSRVAVEDVEEALHRGDHALPNALGVDGRADGKVQYAQAERGEDQGAAGR
jgi:CobQ-like glutamine amidotransferase family enzyme